MSLLGNLLGGEGQQASIIGVVGQLVQRAGGVQGVVSMLQQHGLGEAVQSWVGTGANQPVSGNQLGQALQGGGLGSMLAEAAGKLGINQDELLGKLSQVLPQAVDHVTPDGKVPPAGAVSGFDVAALEGLAGKLFG